MNYKVIYTVFMTMVMSCNLAGQKANETEQLFNGKDLSHWRGDSRVWSVEDGCIKGETTDEVVIAHNTFLIHDRIVSDFELTFKYKIIGGNSGVQYRARVVDQDKFIIGGYQADMEAGIQYSGILYEEKGRGILAQRGEKVVVSKEGKKTVTRFKTTEEIQAVINQEDWNDYRIVAKGNHLQHYINDQLTIDVVDNETGKSASSGVLALQLHAGPSMQVFYRDLELKKL
ncbi:DUF1080 domain-containing protein [Maribacter polysiphoniae]|uniref:DUF1080 domain-containing protein n=1 Tax=Maribacter polysiphoniae TaxID=429344 RepID=A0A316DU34_9FLAO|nr:DUF1080 domain-containing protein [Maribacter polysiphoniae]MBD1262126.1 DUF1080 domain-containing protein [Maribacter polysiphoniae]PWK21817.1 uncharacterized protein DUF1080 [Maribacter polysiphoniae]